MINFHISPFFANQAPAFQSEIISFSKRLGIRIVAGVEALGGEKNFIFARSQDEFSDFGGNEQNHIVFLSQTNIDLFEIERVSNYYELKDASDLKTLLSLLEWECMISKGKARAAVYENFIPYKKFLINHRDDVRTWINTIMVKGISWLESSHIDDLIHVPYVSDSIPATCLYMGVEKILHFEGKEPSIAIAACYAANIISEVYELLDYDERYLLEAKENLNKLDCGLAILNQQQDLIWVNQFIIDSNLNPNDFKNKKVINQGEQIFCSEKIELQSGEILLRVEKKHRVEVGGSEELGIITSSIAHELNNPLGGILAALDVIMLDCDDQKLDSLKDMKSTVLRCEKLVNTFLGFSRKQVLETGAIDLKNVISQAYDLIKFRLIENNYQLKWKLSQAETFKIAGNESVMIMVFYLLFNELLTSKSHENLITGRDNKLISIDFSEQKNFIRIDFEKDIPVSKLEQGSLIENLFELNQLKLQLNSDHMIIDAL